MDTPVPGAVPSAPADDQSQVDSSAAPISAPADTMPAMPAVDDVTAPAPVPTTSDVAPATDMATAAMPPVQADDVADETVTGPTVGGMAQAQGPATAEDAADVTPLPAATDAMAAPAMPEVPEVDAVDVMPTPPPAAPMG